MIRSLTPPQAAGNALAFAVQGAQAARHEAYNSYAAVLTGPRNAEVGLFTRPS
jgi:hypothetical protein